MAKGCTQRAAGSEEGKPVKDLYRIMRDRRSIRKYKPDPVPAEALTTILSAGGLAPSGANRQPWLYVVVDDPAVKREIRRLSEEADARWNAEQPAGFRSWLRQQDIAENAKPFLEAAPLLLCVFGRTGEPYWLESTWISVSYLLLATEEQGLGTLTYTPGYPGFLNVLLEVPESFSPQAILPLGYADEVPEPKVRPGRELATYVHKNQFR